MESQTESNYENDEFETFTMSQSNAAKHVHNQKRTSKEVQSSDNYSDEEFDELSASKSMALSQSGKHSKANKNKKMLKNYQSPIKETDEENKGLGDDSKDISRSLSKKASPDHTDTYTASAMSHSHSKSKSKKRGI